MTANLRCTWRVIVYTPVLIALLAVSFLVLPKRLSSYDDVRHSSKTLSKTMNIGIEVLDGNLPNSTHSIDDAADNVTIDDTLQQLGEHAGYSPELKKEINESNNGSVINFFRESNRFVSTFADCIEDKACKIYYHHVGKTGGSTVESRMYSMFPVKFNKKSCCFQTMLARFEKHKKDFCSAKFTAYQVMGWGFEKVVSECMNKNAKGSRAIALTSFREPIQRTLSNIHQNCNKNFSKRSNETKVACKNCSYEKDSEVWDKFVRETNRVYTGIMQVSNMNIKNVVVMTVDMEDINLMFSMLNASLHNLHVPSKTRNSESLSRCSFGMTSPMFKALGPSEAIYRNLTLGL